jgi:hypothetical protein
MRNVRIRPWTVVLLVLAVAFLALGVMYFVTAARDLPSFVPGHQAGATTHHVKHGLAMLGLAVLALIGAWFTTSPDRDSHAPSGSS